MIEYCLHKSNLARSMKEIERVVSESEKPLRCTIKKWVNKRSLDQNSLNWLWCTEIANQANEVSAEQIGKKDVHEYYKNLYCPEKTKVVFGVEIKIKSTKLLDTGEMHFYLNQLEYDARSRGLNLTIPNDCEYQKLKDKQVE